MRRRNIKIFILFFIGLGYSVTAQVGINTENPEATLDIRAVNHNGAVTANDGVLVPRVNDLAVAGSQEGQLVYLIANIGSLEKGFFYWNGNQWFSMDKTSGSIIAENLVEPDASISSQGPVQSFSVSPNTPIASNQAYTINIPVSGVSGTTTLVTLTINITHTYDGDLDIFLGDPTGNWLELSTDNGGGGENFDDTTFDDSATVNITAGTAPFSGSYKPEGTLSASGTPVSRTGNITTLAGFNGLNPNGTWTIRFGDDAGLDTGTFNDATLNISGSLPLQWVSLAEVSIDYFDDTAIIVQSNYSGDPINTGGINTALTRSTASVATGTVAAALPGIVLSYSSTATDKTGNAWVNTSNLARDEGLSSNTTYYYQLWRQGNIEIPLATNETFTLIPFRLGE